MPRNESGLVRDIVRAVRAEHPGAWCFKVHGSPTQTVGTPDLLICVEGLLIAAEVKHQKPGESREHALSRATEVQLAQIEVLRRAGATAGVVLSAEETLALIDHARREAGHIPRS